MTDWLFLPDPLDGAWHTTEGTYANDADKRALAGREMVVVLSGQSVRALPHELPTLRARERMQAARFHIEPMMAGDVDSLHLAIGETRLLAVSREVMDATIAALSDAGVTPIAIYADHDVLPPATLHDRIVLDAATVDHGFPLDSLPEKLGLSEVAALADTSAATDLLTGDYAPSRMPAFAANLGWLRNAAAVLAAMGVSWFALQASESRAERLQVADLRERAASAYTAATGQTSATPARDAALLVSAPDTAGALDLVAILFEALQEVDGASVDQLSFDNGQLDLDLAYPSFAATSQLEAAVSRAGGRLRAGGVREVEGRYLGQATLTPGAN